MTAEELAKLSDSEKRIRIAELCGYTQISRSVNACENEPCAKPPRKELENINGWSDIPDYLNDLNAMHEAEKVFEDKLANQYEYNLAAMMHPNASRVFMWSATAAQRADAFLLTLG